MKKQVLVVIFFALGIYSKSAVDTSYSLDELCGNKNSYLTQVNGIRIEPPNKIIFYGNQGKEKIITAPLIKELLYYSKVTDSYPECIIDHSAEENETYNTFSQEFATRPLGSDGTRAALDWRNNKTYQNVKLNVSPYTFLSKYLFDADLEVKKLIMGKKSLKTGKFGSFAGFAQMNMYDYMAGKNEIFQDKFETVFYLVPDTLETKKMDKGIQLIKTRFKLIPYANDKEKSLEKIWANEFNQNIVQVFSKHKELDRIQQIFNTYFLLRNVNVTYDTASTQFDKCRLVPDKIRTIKVCKSIETPDELINEPGRYRFIWLLISGAISFDYKKAYIKQL